MKAMKAYYFTYRNCYKETCGILAYGTNRKEARNKIPFACTYRRVWNGGCFWLIDTTFN